MSNFDVQSKQVPDEVLQLPRLNHSVRQIRILVSAVLCMQLKPTCGMLINNIIQREVRAHVGKTYMSNIDICSQSANVYDGHPNSFTSKPVSMVGLGIGEDIKMRENKALYSPKDNL